MVKKIITSVLVAISLIAGVFFLFFGVKGSVEWNNRTKNYKETVGYYVSYRVYTTDKYKPVRKHTFRIYNQNSYQLTYSYTVDGKEYTVSTDYGVGNLPNQGSTKKILYNPNDPEEAVVKGTNSNSIMIGVGVIFTVVPLFFIFAFLVIQGHIKIGNINWIEVVLGLAFGAGGVGFLYMATGSFSIPEAFRVMGILMGVPLLIVVTGIFLLIRGLFFGKYSRN